MIEKFLYPPAKTGGFFCLLPILITLNLLIQTLFTANFAHETVWFMYKGCSIVLLSFLLFSFKLSAQDNYEIQVYGAKLVAKKRTMVELHSNYSFKGTKWLPAGEYSDNHVFHETIEITHGFTSWFETGFYIFNSIGSDNRTAYVGSHVRPRFAIPEKWKWPVGLSLSFEFGLQKKEFSANTSTLEIRPIIDKKWNKFYFAFNPVFDKSYAGPDQNKGYVYSPNLKGSIDLSKELAVGLEYYGSVGALPNLDPFQQQQHQLFIAADIDFNPDFEFNAGYGWGFTNSTAQRILKVILGVRL